MPHLSGSLGAGSLTCDLLLYGWTGNFKITAVDCGASIPVRSLSRAQHTSKNSVQVASMVNKKNPKGASISEASPRVGLQAADARRGCAGLAIRWGSPVTGH